MKRTSSKILIIDDTPSIIDFIKDSLEQESYQVFIAISGEKGLDIVERINPDIILLDVLMPGINGYETCVKLKENPYTSEIPVIFMSALTESFDKVEAFKAGAIDYLTKPVNNQELLTRIQTHLTARQKIRDERAELQQVNSSIIKFLGEIVYNYDVVNDSFIWSDDISTVLGYSNKQIGTNLESFLTKIKPSNQELFEKQVKQAITNKNAIKFDFQILTSNEKYIWFQNRGTPIIDNKGNVTRIVGILLNMASRKEQEHKQLQAVVRGVDLERKRIAAEIHDGLGQTLIAANFILSSIEDHLPEESQKKQDTVKNLIDEAIIEGRELSHNLMPKSLEDYGLIASLKTLIHKVSSTKAISIKFHSNASDEKRFPNDMENNLYRVAQESLTNIIKHSGAKNIVFQLLVHDKSLIFTIEDDGKGFSNTPSKSGTGLGIQNIKNRISSIDGMIELDSNQNHGTIITIEVNLPK